MYLSEQDRALYISKLIVNYFNKQKVKDMAHARRQVINMDDKTLKANYDLLT